MVSDLKVSIIIADDHPIFRGGLHSILKKFPFISRVAEAGDGTEVIDLLAAEHFDVVLMDLDMKPMNGFTATQIITEQYPKTKVIALSMHDDEKNIFEIMDKGASGYLIKNAEKEEIEQAIKDVLSGRQFFSREVSNILIAYHNKSKPGKSSEEGEEHLENERMREIIFLLCHEFTSQEIAETLFLSVRTIDWYRRGILKITQSKGLAGIINYGAENGITNDSELKKRFAKPISKKEKQKGS
jgi:DNA-binding NarL/FixJ family response regulator